ncbi:MAG: histidine triad nucleotide-binding protein [Oligoflexia bacterium]|nr:histidine triad nucleotide-binding protein [Oligoflexia bacterium]
MSADCVFCKIVAGTIPSPRLYEDESFIAIRDIQPHAKKHLLVIPKKHLASLNEAFPAQGPGEAELMGKMLEVGVKIARQEGVAESGFRSVINTGKNGTQTVFHIHLHILGGEMLRATLK